jgi:hypothetical protein
MIIYPVTTELENLKEDTLGKLGTDGRITFNWSL